MENPSPPSNFSKKIGEKSSGDAALAAHRTFD
jgi:hypothetical protein